MDRNQTRLLKSLLLLPLKSVFFITTALLLLLQSWPSFAQSGFNEIRDQSGKLVGTYQESHALLIGVSEYQDPGWPNLRSIPRELKEVETILKEQGFQVLKVMDPSSRELKNAFEDFINQFGFDPENRLLIFFSGHGHSRKNGEKGYIVPSDAPHVGENERGFLQKAVTMKQVMTWAERIESKHALFLFDSCFSGTLFQTKEGLPKSPPNITLATSRPVRQFITAGSAGETVPAKSVFTPTLVEALEGKADLDGDHYVTGTELGMYLHRKVVNYEIQQTPQYGKIRDSSLNQGDFVFVLSSSESSRKAKELWEKIKGSNQIPLLLEFVADYPDSPYSNVAQGRINQLNRLQKAEEATWKVLKNTRSSENLRLFLKKYPNGLYSEAAKLKLRELQSSPSLVFQPTPTPSPQSHPPASSPLIPGFVLVQPGSFLMGSENGYENEKPVHEVKIPSSFWIGEHEVTVKEYQEFVVSTGHRKPDQCGKENWGESGRKNYPISCVSLEDAHAYIQWKNKEEKITKNRLCTEAEWEYSARAGTTTPWACGIVEDCLEGMAWYSRNGDNNTKPVKTKKSNSWGIYDLHGNVWEWVEDPFCSYYNSLIESLERTCHPPLIPPAGVIRGGSFHNDASDVRSATRDWNPSSERYGNVGFRLCRSK